MFFCIQKLPWFCWKSSSPLRANKTNVTPTHQQIPSEKPTFPTLRSDSSLARLGGPGRKKTSLQNQRHFICRSVSYLKSTKSCLVFLWGGPKNSRDVQTNMILSLLHLLESITQILRPTLFTKNSVYRVKKQNSKIRIHINPAFPYNVSIFLDLP